MPDVLIGILAPLTGGSSYFGTAIRNGITVAITQFNLTHPTPSIAAVEVDDHSAPADAERGLDELDKAGVAAVIGPMESHSASAIARLAASRGIPVVSPAATGTYLIDSTNRWFFVAHSTDRWRADDAIEWITSRDSQRVILIAHEERSAEQDDGNVLYGESLAKDAQRAILVRGATCREVGYVRGQSEANMKSALASVKWPAIGSVLILGRSSDTLVMAKAVRSCAASVPIYLISPGKEMFSSAHLAGGPIYAITDTLVETVNWPMLEKFRSQYRAQFPSATNLEAIDGYATFGYDAANIVTGAVVRAVHKDVHAANKMVAKVRQAVRDEIDRTPNDRRGIVTMGGFTRDRELNVPPHRLVLTGSVWKPIPPPTPPRPRSRLGAIAWLQSAYDSAERIVQQVESSVPVRIGRIIGAVAASLAAIGALIALLHLLRH